MNSKFLLIKSYIHFLSRKDFFKFAEFLFINKTEEATIPIDIKSAIVGFSCKIKNASNVVKIGFRKANDIPFETSISFTPTKKIYCPKPVDITPKNNIQNHEFISYWKKLLFSGVKSKMINVLLSVFIQ